MAMIPSYQKALLKALTKENKEKEEEKSNKREKEHSLGGND